MPRLLGLACLYLWLIPCMADEYKTSLCIRELLFCQKNPTLAKNSKNFTELVLRSDLFVDKSLLIKEILENPNKQILLTRPHRWGKSINIYMLKAFFEIVTDNHGTPLPINSTWNHRLMVQSKIFFSENKYENLRCPFFISKYQELVEDYLGKVPVIMIDFAHLRANSYTVLMKEITDTIRDTYLMHTYMGNVLNKSLQESNTNTEEIREQLELFDRYRYKRRAHLLTVHDLKQSIKFLSKLLNQHFQRCVYILMDNYDTPWTKMFLSSNFTDDDKRNFLDFYSDFMIATFKNNTYLDRAILKGILSPATEQHQLCFQQIKEYNFLYGELSEYYGFTQWEVDGITYYMKQNEYQKQCIRHWYHGYNVNKWKEKIYETWDIIRFQDGNEMNRHWTCYLPFFDNCLSFSSCRKKYLYLIYRNEIKIKVYHHFTYEQLDLLHKAFSTERYRIKDDCFGDLAMMFLYQHGWITLADKFNPKPNSKYLRLQLPNNHTHELMTWRYTYHYGIKTRMEEVPEDYLRTQLTKFFQNNDSRSESLERAFHYFIRIHEKREYGVVFTNKIKNTITVEDYDILHHILSYIIVGIEDAIYKEAYAPSDKLNRPDAILVFYNQTAIVSFQLDKPSPEAVLEQAKSHAKILKELKYPIKVVKYIGINVRLDRTAHVCAEMQYL